MDNSTKEAKNNKPVGTFHLRGLTAKVFENMSDKGVPFCKATITRTYKSGDDFKTTSVFGRDDLPAVAELSRQSWLVILKREAERSKQQRDD